MTTDPRWAKSDIAAAQSRKPWKKPAIIVASARDDTQDGYTTGTDDGNGNNDFTLTSS